MIYEIVNMSDPYTIEARSLDVAFVACLFLGSGQYAFKPLEEGAEEVPLFLLGGAEQWCRAHFAESVENVVGLVTGQRLDLAACLESCLIGHLKDRETYRAGLELIDDADKRIQWRERWHNDRLSSMNNIGARAYRMAAKLRAGASNPLEPAPQQVFAG